MSQLFKTPHGTIEVAFEELALFFNNDTIEWGWNALKQGMTKDEAQDALEERGFEPVLAEAFLKKMYNNANISWYRGKLLLPTAVTDGRGSE